ncbi:MAG: exo-beta-N-acetylmuramidase NamZ domain-containing protein [Planctomycetaceae bacterium]
MSVPCADRSIPSLACVLAVLMAAAAPAADLPRLEPAAAGFDPARLAAIDGLVEEALAEKKMPGCVVCIGRRDGIAFLKSYGRRAVAPADEPMTTDTVFDLASITKPVATATAVMRLVEEGRLRLADPIATHIPEFAANGKEKLTVHDLLTHQSELIADNPIGDYADGPDRAFEQIWNLTPLHPAGEKFIYSDVNFIVLGRLVEKLSGESLDAFTQRVTFGPLGMTETGYLPADGLRSRCAPTEERDGAWMRGDVHDPRCWKLCFVAGHAGLFGTAANLARYATMMLRGGTLDDARVLSAPTVATMTRGWRIPGGGFRGLGWDKRSPLSSNRGDLLTEAAFGHGGFTGTALWIDPGLDLYVIFLANRVHPDGKGLVNPLIARIASCAAGAIVGPASLATSPPARPVLTGIDVLVRDGFRQLAGKRVAVITNHTGLDRDRRRTAALLARAEGVRLVAIFGPEHGATGTFDQANVPDARDEETGVPVKSLYGKTKRPTAEMLADVDVVVFDIQDIGCRFYTYIATMREAMKAAAEHRKGFVVLDRPNPIDGVAMAGPLVDEGRGTFVGCHPLPLRHGMTVGELARMFAADLELDLDLTVVPCEGWRRGDAFDATGLEWVNPSPNMRSLTEAFLYPGIGLLEFTNLSVGRGTDTPFEVVGAPWLDGRALADALAARRIPGVAFVPIRFTPRASKFAGQECGGVNMAITDRSAVDPVRVGLEIAVALRGLHPQDWQADKVDVLLLHRATLDALLGGKPADAVLESARDGLKEFARRRGAWLLYE